MILVICGTLAEYRDWLRAHYLQDRKDAIRGHHPETMRGTKPDAIIFTGSWRRLPNLDDIIEEARVRAYAYGSRIEGLENP